MEVKHVWTTPNAEATIAYCARVSSDYQENPEFEKLLRYCYRHKHFSIFEMADMCVEITTSRAIAAQLLRHRSFSFQEMSLRYTTHPGFEACAARRQDKANRQNSIDDLSGKCQSWWSSKVVDLISDIHTLYSEALDRGVAKECARMILPLCTQTTVYMKGSVRSWIHYLQVRCDESTQFEHKEVAQQIRKVFCEQFPTIGRLLDEH